MMPQSYQKKKNRGKGCVILNIMHNIKGKGGSVSRKDKLKITGLTILLAILVCVLVVIADTTIVQPFFF